MENEDTLKAEAIKQRLLPEEPNVSSWSEGKLVDTKYEFENCSVELRGY